MNNGKKTTNDLRPNWFDRHGLGALNLVLYVFLWHGRRETETLATSGGAKDSFQEECVGEEQDGLWPRTWLWSRVLLLFAACFGVLYFCWTLEGGGEDSTLLPGMTIVGSLAFPLSMLLFFFEVNKWRSVSLLRALYYFMMGSCVSVVITFVLTTLLDYLPYAASGNHRLQWIAIILTKQPITFGSLFEEIGKTIMIFLFMMHYRKNCRILQGLLIGAAVGAGFAVFESAGYALNSSESLLSSILMRNLAAPACHTAWGAIMGGGLMLITKNRLSYWKLFSPKFWLLFLFVWALHYGWNIMLDRFTFLTHNIQLAIFTLFVVFLLIWAGVKETEK